MPLGLGFDLLQRLVHQDQVQRPSFQYDRMARVSDLIEGAGKPERTEEMG